MAHQTFMKDLKQGVQCELLAEFTDETGHKDTLIDVNKEKQKTAAKPLEGQYELKGG